MLRMKARCERCHAPLAAAGEAAICSYECTFCPPCAAEMRQTCPNCDGELLRRPRRLRAPVPVAAGLVWRRVRQRFGRSGAFFRKEER